MNISSSIFENNLGLLEGGVIKFDSYRPIFTNCTFENNSAPYGEVLAGYPVELKLS